METYRGLGGPIYPDMSPCRGWGEVGASDLGWCTVRLVIAKCQVDYVGRLTAHLPMALRLLLVKADGSVSVHADDRAYKPLNWMSPPCTLVERPGCWTVTNRAGEQLIIEIDGVEQLTRYLDLLNRDPQLAPVRGVFAAQQIKPQAHTLATDRGIRCVTVDYDELRGAEPTEPRLF